MPVNLYRVIIILLALLLMSGNVVLAMENRVQVSNEISRLLYYIETSNCRFNRNGRWFDGVEAAAHINKKYRYVTKKGMVKTTEDFIRYSATKSSMSGKAYMVQCEDSEPLRCSEWLTAELARYRAVQ